MTRVYAMPVNYRDAHGRWRPIDDRLASVGGGGYAFVNRANSYRVAIPEALSRTPLRIFSRGAHVGFRLIGAGGRATARGSTARFAAFRDVSATYTAEAQRVKENLVLSGPHARSSYDYALELSRGLRPRQNSTGGIDVVDRAGHVRYSFLAPFAYDRAGARIDSGRSISLRLLGSRRAPRLRLSVDRAWLAAANRRFPVTIDPGVSVADSQDCMIESGTSAGTNFCGGQTLSAGYDGTKAYRALLKFNVQSAVPANAHITGAFLAAYLSSESTTTPVSIGAYALTRAWTTGATWNTYNGTSSWTAGGGDFQSTATNVQSNVGGSTGSWYYWGASAITQQWYDGTTANNGLLLKEPTESTNNVLGFNSAAAAANKPYMEVDWQPNYLGVQSWYPMISQSLTDRSSYSVNVANGNLVVQSKDLAVAGTGIPMTVNRTWNGQSYDQGEFGKYWTMNGGYDIFLNVKPDAVSVFDPTYSSFRFQQNADGSYATPPGIDATLKRNADGTFTLTYNRSGASFNFNSGGDQLLSVKDRNGNTISYAYNASDQPSTITDTQQRITNLSYVSSGGSQDVSQITDASGRHVNYGYTNDHLTSYTDGAGKTTTYAYDGSGNLTQITDPVGDITVFTYDTSYRVTSIKRVTNNSTMAGDTTTFTYNAGNTVVTDPLGHATTYNYDSSGRPTGTSQTVHGDPTQPTVTQTRTDSQVWNSQDFPTTYNSPLNGSNPSTNAYSNDGKNNLTSSTGPSGNPSGSPVVPGAKNSFTYSSPNAPYQPDTATNPQGNTLSFSYDSNQNLQSVVGQVGGAAANQVTYTYDPSHPGRITKSTDADNDATNYGYDAKGNLTTITPPLPQGATTLGIDANTSRTTSVTDGLNQKTTYTYDGDDRVTRIDFPDASYATYTYDGDGNLTQRYDSAASATSTYTYDLKNRQTQAQEPGDAGESGPRTLLYGYDAADNLTSLTDGAGTPVTYAYNEANEACWLYLGSSSNGCTSPPTGATTFVYDKDGNRTKTNYPGGITQTATWDGADRPSEIKATRSGGGSGTLPDFQYLYTKLIGSTNTDIDAVAQQTDVPAGITTTYAYDTLGRLKDATPSSGTTYHYDYDANSNIADKVIGGTKTSYDYGTDNQLCWSVSGSLPTNPACGSPPTGATAFSYDANDNVTTDGARGTITYNSRQQSTNVFGVAMSYVGPGQADRSQSGDTSYAYNLLGQGHKDLSGSAYYYTRDPGGTLVDERIVTGGSTSVYNYLFDGLGSVVALTDSGGNVVNNYRYDPFGNTTTSTESVDNQFQFASGIYGTSTHLTKFGDRFYDAAIGRWTQPDPIDAAGIQQANRDVYAADDPVNENDVTGLSQGCGGATAEGKGAQCRRSGQASCNYHPDPRGCMRHDPTNKVLAAEGVGCLAIGSAACGAGVAVATAVHEFAP